VQGASEFGKVQTGFEGMIFARFTYAAVFRSSSQAVLAVGNALNDSTFRGGARGFQLEALQKVHEFASELRDLMHYRPSS